MWIPEVSIINWLQIFPELIKELPLKCLCGKENTDIKPFVAKNWVGIVTNNCDCGLGMTSISLPRNEALSKALKNALLQL